MHGLTEYICILMMVYAATMFAPTFLSLLNTVADVGDESGHAGEDKLLVKAVKGGIVMIAALCTGFPVTLLFSGQNGRREFFRPRAAYADYQAKMELYKARLNRQNMTINLQVPGR